jgi:hypothetical protein
MAVTGQFHPSGYYHLAQQLIQTYSTSEAALRTAINRYYLACMLVARDRLMQGKWRPNPNNPEGQYAEIERELRSRNRRNLSRQLHALRERRVHADYHANVASDETNSSCDICEIRRQRGALGAVDLEFAIEVQDLANTVFAAVSIL